jgi:serine/threonine-protein phosphatase 6 regulatory subunit 3
MSLLNRPPGVGPQYDINGRLQGGLPALEELAYVIAAGASHSVDTSGSLSDDENEMEPAKDFPVSSTSHSVTLSSPSLDSEDSFSGEEDADDVDQGSADVTVGSPETHAGQAVDANQSLPPEPHRHSSDHNSDDFKIGASRISTRSRSRSRPRSGARPPGEALCIGERFKQALLLANVLSSVLVSCCNIGCRLLADF